MTNYKVFDGHNDTLPKLRETSDFLKKSDVLRSKSDVCTHVDLPRAREGGMIGGFFAIFTPPPEESPERDPYYGLSFTKDGYDVSPRSPIDHDYARAFTDGELTRLQALEREAGDRLAVVHGYEQLKRNADMPADLSDASQLPNLFYELEDRGYDRESLQNIAHGNWFRVLRETWQN